MTPRKKRQISTRTDESKDFTKNTASKKGDFNKVLKWYQSAEKDEELANNVEMAVERMRRELKLHRVCLG
jgi:hypothetical protein